MQGPPEHPSTTPERSSIGIVLAVATGTNRKASNRKPRRAAGQYMSAAADRHAMRGELAAVAAPRSRLSRRGRVFLVGGKGNRTDPVIAPKNTQPVPISPAAESDRSTRDEPVQSAVDIGRTSAERHVAVGIPRPLRTRRQAGEAIPVRRRTLGYATCGRRGRVSSNPVGSSHERLVAQCPAHDSWVG